MSDPTLGDLARLVRSKNAGPFWLTLDVFLDTDADYRRAADAVTGEAVARAYHVDPANVRVHRLPGIRVIKASFPRPVVQGGLGDRDMHSGQQYLPLAAIPVPEEQES
jgi:Domain of unknown function (DUF4387)